MEWCSYVRMYTLVAHNKNSIKLSLLDMAAHTKDNWQQLKLSMH